MSKTRASALSRVPNNEKQMKALGLRPRAFICFSVFGTRDKALALVFDILRQDYEFSSLFLFKVYSTRAKHASLACEQALLFGRVKRVSRERASERRSREGPRSREAHFAYPNRRACSQANASSEDEPASRVKRGPRRRKNNVYSRLVPAPYCDVVVCNRAGCWDES